MANTWAKDVQDKIDRQHAEALEHAGSCTADPCARCERYRCKRGCGAKVEWGGSVCAGCKRQGRVLEWQRATRNAVPGAFAEITLESDWLAKLVGLPAISAARAALAATRAAFTGPPGAGKTSLAAAMFMASEFAEHEPQSPVWVSSYQLARARAVHPLGAGEAPLVMRAMRATLLVVDEVGGEDAAHASAVKDVLFERHAQNHATWVTTGVGPKEIADRYGGGIARRIFEDARVFRLAGRAR